MGWATLSAAANRVAFNRLGGVSVTAGAASGMGILNRNAELVSDGNVISVEYHLTVESAIFGDLHYGEAITVDGESFMVRQAPMQIGDGTDCFVLLEKLTPGASAPGAKPRRFGLADLYDVSDDIDNAAAGRVIKYDGIKWKDAKDDGEAYVFTQPAPAVTWVINHNLGYKPSVELINSGSQEIEGDVIHTSVNQTIVNFTSPIAGLARLV